MKIKKGDEIIVTVGKDKGKKGKVEKVFAKEQTVIVPGINEYKKHVKARMQGQQSEIVTITVPLAETKIALVCSKCHKQTRVGYKIENGKKVRVCKKCDKNID